MVSVVEEVRTRCPVKNRSNIISTTPTTTNTNNIPSSNVNPISHLPQSHSSTSIADIPAAGSTSLNVQQGNFTRRLKPWDPSYLDKTRKIGGVSTMNSSRLSSILPHARYYPMDIENAIPRILIKPASTLVQLQQTKQAVPAIAVTPQILPEAQQTPQVKYPES